MALKDFVQNGGNVFVAETLLIKARMVSHQDISRNAIASGSSVCWCSEPDSSAFRLIRLTK